MPAKGSFIDISGQRFGRLTVIDRAAPYVYQGKPFASWNCLCECGRRTVQRADQLRHGKVSSCGDISHRESRRVDLAGRRFGRWLVVELCPGKGPVTRWICRCDCGEVRDVAANMLRNGDSRSCGCLKRERIVSAHLTHGMTKTPTYRIWAAMISRCTNSKRKDWNLYGGRGISVCDRWRHSFESFIADMGEQPPGRSIDRFPNQNGNYEPGNCRWATSVEQGRNMRSSVVTRDMAVEILASFHNGESRKSIAERLRISRGTVDHTIQGKSWKELERPWLAATVSSRSE